MNSSGKVLIIFLAISAILLVSLTAVSLYFVHLETDKRKLAEATLEEYQTQQTKLDEELKALEKQNSVLQEKNKEAEERVIDLSDELELERGLKEEMKKETATLQEKITGLEKEKGEFTKEMEEGDKKYEKLSSQLASSEKKITELTQRLQSEMERSQKLSELYEKKQKEEAENAARLKETQEREAAEQQAAVEETPSPPQGIELEEIVIAPKEHPDSVPVEEPVFDDPVPMATKETEGRILSVDRETEFVVVNLGEEDGLSLGRVLSVYRNADYIGDIKITRLQSDMAAADPVLPLPIKNIRKDDRVKIK